MINGKEFENLLESKLKILDEKKIGFFVKSPTPFRSVPSGNSYKLIYSAKALCDFVGIYKGTFFLLEAKSISGASFSFNRLKEHQVEQLKKIQTLGGIGYIIFNIIRKNKIIAMNINNYLEALSSTTMKSIHIDLIERDGYYLGEEVDFELFFSNSIKFDNTI